MTARLNEHGVFVDGVEVVVLSDRGKKQKAEARIAEHAGCFFWGAKVAYGGLAVGSAHHAFLPQIRSPHPPQRSRAAALLAARRYIADFVYDSEGVRRGALGAGRHQAVYKYASGILRDVEPMVQMDLFKRKRSKRWRKK